MAGTMSFRLEVDHVYQRRFDTAAARRPCCRVLPARTQPQTMELSSTMLVTIRDATIGDAHAIASVNVASWQLAYRGLLPDELLDGLSVTDGERRWSDILCEPAPRSGFLVACDRGEVVGFASFGARDEEEAGHEAGELYTIYLHPDHWRHGIGTRLHTEALRRLSALGFVDATVWVLVGNERAISFYQRVGWTADGGQRTEIRRGGFKLTDIRLRRML